MPTLSDPSCIRMPKQISVSCSRMHLYPGKSMGSPKAKQISTNARKLANQDDWGWSPTSRRQKRRSISKPAWATRILKEIRHFFQEARRKSNGPFRKSGESHAMPKRSFKKSLKSYAESKEFLRKVFESLEDKKNPQGNHWHHKGDQKNPSKN